MTAQMSNREVQQALAKMQALHADRPTQHTDIMTSVLAVECKVRGISGPTDRDKLVAKIRTICSREFDALYTDRFFELDYEEGETADHALVRLFRHERPNHDTDEEAILVLCHG